MTATPSSSEERKPIDMLTAVRFTVSFGLALVLAVFGLALRNLAVAALSLCPLFYSMTLLLSYLALPHHEIEARRGVDRSRAAEGEPIGVQVSLATQKGSYPMVFVHDELPDGLSCASGDVHYQGPLSLSQPRATLQYTLEGRRGLYDLGGIHALVWSRFGLALTELTVQSPVTLRVLPASEQLGVIPIRPRRTRAFAGPIRSNLPGVGIDFYGCRAFAPGDDIRRIDWRAYARTEELVICEYEQERITDVSLILDARSRAHAAIGSHRTFEFAAQATASLASSFCRQGNNVGLLIYGDVLNWVFPGVGRSQIDRIHDALSTARLANKLAFEDLRHIPTRLFLPHSQLVLVSCHLDEADIETLALLRMKGYSILFVSIDTIPLESDQLPPSGDTALAVRIARLRRSLYLQSLERYGVQVIDWNPTVPLAQAIERARRMHRRMRP